MGASMPEQSVPIVMRVVMGVSLWLAVETGGGPIDDTGCSTSSSSEISSSSLSESSRFGGPSMLAMVVFCGGSGCEAGGGSIDASGGIASSESVKASGPSSFCESVEFVRPSSLSESGESVGVARCSGGR